MVTNSTFNTNSATFDEMMKRFSVLTVMNAEVHKFPETVKNQDASTALTAIKESDLLCKLDTLKIANVTIEGPNKTVTGGQYSNPLVKFGKTARLEMQDALGNIEALAYLGGGIAEYTGVSLSAGSDLKLHVGETFNGPVSIIGDTFFIDQKTGTQIPVTIIFYQFLPDSIFNLSQDAEGDATVFDLNGDLLATDIKVDSTNTTGIFYSIVKKTV